MKHQKQPAITMIQPKDREETAGGCLDIQELFSSPPTEIYPAHEHSQERGLYIHIPFCVSKCSYCDFASFAGQDHRIEDYLQALSAELQVLSQLTENEVFTSIFLGGGTPTALGKERLAYLLDQITSQFHLADDAEWTCEANPESATLEILTAARQAGVNRLSLGVQSFDTEELRLLARIHGPDAPQQALVYARAAGFENISLDLMFGLPEQRIEAWEETLDRALALNSKHLSIYGLILEGGTPLEKQVAQGCIPQPGEQSYLDMENLLIDKLQSAGFIRYEISNWSLPGYQSRHNRLYWRQDPWLGAGLSAHTFWRGRRYCHSSDLDTYIRAWQGPRHSGVLCDIHGPEIIDPAREAEDAVIFGLRMIEGIDCENFLKRYGYRLEDRWHMELAQAFERNWLVMTEGHLCLHPSAIPISNEVFELFIDIKD